MPKAKSSNGNTKKERLAQEIAKAVGAGRPIAVETVDFNDPNRPKTCLEVDFPIVPVNMISAVEGSSGATRKPIYQLGKWWARRNSSVFRSMLISACTKAPSNPAQAAKVVWDAYYANHQKSGLLNNIKVLDPFMGGGTTIVEGSRLGMQLSGCDLNPVAWFIVENSLRKIEPAKVQALLACIQAEVRPQIMPFYACDCPRGHKGRWKHSSTGEFLDEKFSILTLSTAERKDYVYEGPEFVYVFWVKHGQCQVTGCSHRTPILTSPVVASKTITVKAWEDFRCTRCDKLFDVEAADARLAPGVPLVRAETEKPHSVLRGDTSVVCPHCQFVSRFPILEGAGKNKKIELTLLIHPDWMKGTPSRDRDGQTFGGSCGDDLEMTSRWYAERAQSLKLVEVRGLLPPTVTCPETGVTFATDQGSVQKRSTFSCQSCGHQQEVVQSTKALGKTAPIAALAAQAFCPSCAAVGVPYEGRFFMPACDVDRFVVAEEEWDSRKNTDLHGFWPDSEIPFGHETHQRRPLPDHGFTHYWQMFNSRQLLVHSLLLKEIWCASGVQQHVKEYVLVAFQQYLRNQCMFAFWNIQADQLEPHFSNNNYHPKATAIENSVFSHVGRGNWTSCVECLTESNEFASSPWETVSHVWLKHFHQISLDGELSGKSTKVPCGDPVRGAVVRCSSATDLSWLEDGSQDLVITDPPFGDNIQYSELADFFYVWMRLVLKDVYPTFIPPYTPKTLEAVSNRARQPDDPNGYYKRVLTDGWREANRKLKPGGLLAFTFHHSEDDPWVAVLESLFDAGFYLEATYPIRGDETKGEGQFGSQKIEYDIIHVCRKQIEEPKAVSWARMRREALQEVRQMANLLELHHQAGLPAGDLKVIKRGKALEYFSRHYGKVFVDEGKPFSVRDALIGINQLLDEESGGGQEAPPVNAEPMTRQFLRLFDGISQQPRDQMQKLLRGTTIDPSEYEERRWCKEEQKIYHLVSPLDIAREWYGKHRHRLTTDYDQAMVLIGASFPQSGMNVTDTLNNPNFRPHPALGRLLKWHSARGSSSQVRNAAIIASQIYGTWEAQNQDRTRQMKLFFDDGEED